MKMTVNYQYRKKISGLSGFFLMGTLVFKNDELENNGETPKRWLADVLQSRCS